MEKGYMTINCAGFVAYCNALIARDTGDLLQACMASLIGSPSNIKAISAILFNGESCNISEYGMKLTFFSQAQSFRSRKVGEVVNKIIITNLFGKNTSYATVFGPDLPVVQERAFRTLDAGTTIPLKHQWQEWLWDTILYPEKLFCFGDDDFQEAYIITLPTEAKLEEAVMDAIRTKEIR